MTSIKRGNQRRRNRELKQGGLYTMQRSYLGPTWAETGTAVIDTAYIQDEMERIFGL